MTLFLLTLLLSTFDPIGPNPIVGWDQVAPSLTEANGYVYKYYLDGATTGQTFGGVSCSGNVSPYVCYATLPVTTSGDHTLTMTTGLSSGPTSPVSAPVSFTIVASGLTAPESIVITKGGN